MGKNFGSVLLNAEVPQGSDKPRRCFGRDDRTRQPRLDVRGQGVYCLLAECRGDRTAVEAEGASSCPLERNLHQAERATEENGWVDRTFAAMRTQQKRATSIFRAERPALLTQANAEPSVSGCQIGWAPAAPLSLNLLPRVVLHSQ